MLRDSASAADIETAEGTMCDRQQSIESLMTAGLESAQPGVACIFYVFSHILKAVLPMRMLFIWDNQQGEPGQLNCWFPV